MTTNTTTESSILPVLPMLTIGDRFASRRDVAKLFDGNTNHLKNPILTAAHARVTLLNEPDWNAAFLAGTSRATVPADGIALVFRSRTRRHVDSRPYTEYVFEGVFNTDKTGRLLNRKANTTHNLTLAA